MPALRDRLPSITGLLSALLITIAAHAEQEPVPAEVQPAGTPALHPFTARYTTEWSLGWFSIDINAVRTLRQLPGGHWQLTFEAETSGAGLTETSEFTFSDGQVIPQEYRYRATGLFNEADRTLIFAPALKLVRDLENNREYTKAWNDSVQDNLTYMLQAGLDLAQGATSLSYDVFEKNRSKAFEFEVIGEEPLKTAIGTLNTIKVKQVRRKNNRQIYAWFATDHHYQLVRLSDKKDGKTRYQIDITDLK